MVAAIARVSIVPAAPNVTSSVNTTAASITQSAAVSPQATGSGIGVRSASSSG